MRGKQRITVQNKRIRNFGKYGTFKQTYQEFFPIYQMEEAAQVFHPEIIITEDSHAGYQFFQAVSKAAGFDCSSAAGKSNIFEAVLKVKRESCGKHLLIIADGAAFGSEMGKIIPLIKEEERLFLYLPESFEWLILKSGILESHEIQTVLSEPVQSIESGEYKRHPFKKRPRNGWTLLNALLVNGKYIASTEWYKCLAGINTSHIGHGLVC